MLSHFDVGSFGIIEATVASALVACPEAMDGWFDLKGAMCGLLFRYVQAFRMFRVTGLQ